MPTFESSINRYLFKLINDNKCGLIDGNKLGIKGDNGKVLLIDNWLENTKSRYKFRQIIMCG